MNRNALIYFAVGFFLSAVFFGVINLSWAALKLDYPYSEYEPGTWIDDKTQFFTYESLCSGYYLVDYSNKQKIKYTGYGDLANLYTYEVPVISFISPTSSAPSL